MTRAFKHALGILAPVHDLPRLIDVVQAELANTATHQLDEVRDDFLLHLIHVPEVVAAQN